MATLCVWTDETTRERLTKLFRIRAAWRLTFWRASSSHRRCASSSPTRIVPPGSPRAPDAGAGAAIPSAMALRQPTPSSCLEGREVS